MRKERGQAEGFDFVVPLSQGHHQISAKVSIDAGRAGAVGCMRRYEVTNGYRHGWREGDLDWWKVKPRIEQRGCVEGHG